MMVKTFFGYTEAEICYESITLMMLFLYLNTYYGVIRTFELMISKLYIFFFYKINFKIV